MADPGTLRAEVDAAVIKAIQCTGSDFDQAAIVKQFAAKGASRATLYRWVKEAAQRSGPAMAREVKRVVTAKKKKASRTGSDTSTELAREVAEVLPPAVDPHDLVDAAVHPLIRKLNNLILSGERVLLASSAPDGTPINKKMVLAAIEIQRRCLDTVVKTAEVINGAAQTEAFHQAVLEEVAKESPEVAGRILLRLRHLMARWGL